MFEFFTLAITQPNFDKIPAPKLTSVEISQVRTDYKITINPPPRIDFDRFLPKETTVIEVPHIEDGETGSNHIDEPLKPQTTNETKKNIGNWLKNKFLRSNSKEIREDIKVCNDAGGDIVIAAKSAGDAEISCFANNGEGIEIDIPGNLPTIVEKLSTRGVEAKIGLKLVANKYGKLVIGFTQEKFPLETKVLFEKDGFILKDQTTYNRFFIKIQNEIAIDGDSIRNDVDRLNLQNQNASLIIESMNGVSTVKCLNGDGGSYAENNKNIEIIRINNLSPRTQKFVQKLSLSSKFGYNTKAVFNPDYKYNITPLYQN
jgi:hypothetical protein